jgi:uncharacterized protein YjbJ (UPF0337 family)
MADEFKRGVDKQLEGMGDEIKGRAKNVVGGLHGDTKEQIKGKAQELRGKAQRKIGEVQEDRDLDKDRDDRDVED